jgi:hypothetical protein
MVTGLMLIHFMVSYSFFVHINQSNKKPKEDDFHLLNPFEIESRSCKYQVDAIAHNPIIEISP